MYGSTTTSAVKSFNVNKNNEFMKIYSLLSIRLEIFLSEFLSNYWILATAIFDSSIIVMFLGIIVAFLN